MLGLQITPSLTIHEADIQESFIRSSGPGGQNVNKVSSAVELRFDMALSSALAEPVKERLRVLAGRRMTKDGVLVLHGNRYRNQQRNREDVRERLTDLLLRALAAPRARKPTRPPRISKEKRLRQKRARSMLKHSRSTPGDT